MTKDAPPIFGVGQEVMNKVTKERYLVIRVVPVIRKNYHSRIQYKATYTCDLQKIGSQETTRESELNLSLSQPDLAELVLPASGNSSSMDEMLGGSSKDMFEDEVSRNDVFGTKFNFSFNLGWILRRCSEQQRCRL